jgi:UDP-N-acetylglucosamine acyltransferase
VGPDTVIREFVTINRGTKASGATRVGARCFLMTYSHLGHDCQVGDDVTIANSTEISGHVIIQDHANISGLVAVHQFVTIGTHCFVGGATARQSGCATLRQGGGQPHGAVRSERRRASQGRFLR